MGHSFQLCFIVIWYWQLRQDVLVAFTTDESIEIEEKTKKVSAFKNAVLGQAGESTVCLDLFLKNLPCFRGILLKNS